MKTKKILYGSLAGTVCMFLLGATIYGFLLSGFMEANTNSAIAKPMEQMNMGAMILSNLMWALLLSLIIDWSGSWSAGAGMRIGAMTGLLGNLGFTLTMYSTTTLYTSLMVLVVDTLAFAVMTAATGALIGWVMSKVGSEKTAVA